MPDDKKRLDLTLLERLTDRLTSMDERLDRNHEVLKDILEELRARPLVPPVPAVPPTIIPRVPPVPPAVVVIPSEVREVLPPEIRVLPPEITVSWGPLLGIFDLLRKYREIEEWKGEYRSIEKTVNANKSNVELRLLIPARMINLRMDQDITIRLNSKANDEITLESAESPMDISGLKPKMLIDKIYVTTGANDTEIKIMAFG